MLLDNISAQPLKEISVKCFWLPWQIHTLQNKAFCSFALIEFTLVHFTHSLLRWYFKNIVHCLTCYPASTRSDFIYSIFIYDFVICLEVIIHAFQIKLFWFRHIPKILCTISRSAGFGTEEDSGILLKFSKHRHYSVSYLVLKSHPFSVTA